MKNDTHATAIQLFYKTSFSDNNTTNLIKLAGQLYHSFCVHTNHTASIILFKKIYSPFFCLMHFLAWKWTKSFQVIFIMYYFVYPIILVKKLILVCTFRQKMILCLEKPTWHKKLSFLELQSLKGLTRQFACVVVWCMTIKTEWISLTTPSAPGF